MITNLRDARIAFIGAGSIAEAMIRGLIQQNIARPGHIVVTNRSNHERLQELQNRYQIRIPMDSEHKEELIRQADIVVLAIKPKDAGDTLPLLKPLLHTKQLIVSVIAGLTIETMESLLDPRLPIVRSMPNTSITIGLGVTGLSFSSRVTSAQQELASDIFESVGIVTIVEESKLDLVTGISGCGPAYVYYMMEAIQKAGIANGLSEEDARALTIQTVLGAAHMTSETGESPETLRRKVSSPGGATMAAIEVLEQHQFSDTIGRAVMRATHRSKEMGEEIASKCLR